MSCSQINEDTVMAAIGELQRSWSQPGRQEELKEFESALADLLGQALRTLQEGHPSPRLQDAVQHVSACIVAA